MNIIFNTDNLIVITYPGGVNIVEVRNINQLKECDGLIIPGGESTVLIKWLRKHDAEVRYWYVG